MLHIMVCRQTTASSTFFFGGGGGRGNKVHYGKSASDISRNLDSREDRESSVNLLLNSTVNTSKTEH